MTAHGGHAAEAGAASRLGATWTRGLRPLVFVAQAGHLGQTLAARLARVDAVACAVADGAPTPGALAVYARGTWGDGTDRGEAEALRALRDLTARHGHALWVRSRADLAVAVGADAVQLPERGLPVAAVRAGFPELGVGASRHDRQGVAAAFAQGADWVTVSPIYPPHSKPLGSRQDPLGPSGLAAFVAAADGPLVALGGLDADSARECWGLGAAAAALSGALSAPTTGPRVATSIAAALTLRNPA